ncbi:LytTR family transcriptional regulator DNA-binding domain-containing protein [Emticicia sp. SJ17W-69]|uniref:LytTR family transcriptional regulator DNA-binding domain-containing protein n=1 Tax=Emticicia sp. SJ17W-69 TaxID=3421657 RepID=UPI003EBE76B6
MKNKPNPQHSILLQNAHNQVVRLEGAENYTRFIFDDGRTQLMSYSLKMYNNSLEFPFIRVSKSCIVNLQFYKNFCSINKKILLSDGAEIQVSRRRLGEVSKFIVFT